uniref:Secreted protein n=1 Tax=Steinernema glaseri TaxID=37863 RepID=A0A1I7ZE20_9BILA
MFKFASILPCFYHFPCVSTAFAYAAKISIAPVMNPTMRWQSRTSSIAVVLTSVARQNATYECDEKHNRHERDSDHRNRDDSRECDGDSGKRYASLQHRFILLCRV